MSVRYSKKHTRRQPDEAHQKWVSVDPTGLLVSVHPPNWRIARTFDFCFLAPFASLGLAQALGLSFGLFAARFARSTAVSRFQVFKTLWAAVAAQAKFPPEATNLRTGQLADWWGKAAREYAVAEYQRARKQTTAKTTVQYLAAVLDELASCGLLVDVPPVVPPKNLHLRKVPRPGLFELAAAATKASSDEKSELVRHFRSIGVPVEDPEAETYIGFLAGLLSPEERKDPKKVSHAYVTRSNDYLAALTKAAETEFLKCQQHYEEGQHLIELARPEVLVAFDAGQLAHWSPKDFRRFFPKRDSTTATANLLLLVRERYKGRIPAIATLERPFRSRLLNLVRELGGLHWLDAMLTLHRNGVAAAAFLYIVDTGANVATAISLEAEFERPTSEPNVVEFFGVKARANYAAIYDCLPVNDTGRRISTVSALRTVLTMTSTLRENFPNLGQSLFIFRFFAEPSIANADFLAHQFGYLLSSAKLPPEWTLSGVRAAVGVIEALDGTGTLSAVRRKLHHGRQSTATTAGYALRWPVRKSLELRMAKYQNLFQAGVASNLEGALAWLHKSPEEADQLLKEAQRTGLGFLCASPKAGARPGTKAGSPCGKVGECVSCEVRVFLVDEESLAEVMATNSSLNTNMARLKSESAERFDEFWIELLAFTTVAIEEAKRSSYAYLVPRAARKAEEWIAAGFDITDLRP